MKEVLVIGGGVIGLCSAYYCAHRGANVTVLERGSADDRGCSYGNAGMIVPSHFVPLAAPGMVALGLKWMWNPESPFYIKPRLNAALIGWGMKFWHAATPAHVQKSAPFLRDLHLASRECFETIAATIGSDFGLVKQGLLMLCKSEHALAEEIDAAKVARALEIPAEVLSPPQIAKLDPDVTMNVAGGIYYPHDCHLSPDRFMQSLKQELRRLNVRMLWNTEVTGWQTANGRIQAAVTSDGEIVANEYVLCGGSWSPILAKSLKISIPMQAGKGYSLTLQHPRQLPNICAIFAEARVAVTPMGGTLRFGGTMEMAGINEEINKRRVDGIIKAIPGYYPNFRPSDFDDIQPWCGLRPCSPDGLPYIGRTASYRNLTIASGHAMMGLSLAPITGKLVSQILNDEKPPIDLRLVNPDRYS
ncbi:MAG: dadA [Verrucomicrobiales bacterium]|nr:dadA [Verrucomicrobiales bacterium]